jgi:hypothetical protein
MGEEMKAFMVIGAAALYVSELQVTHAEQYDIYLTASCSTDETGVDGVRHGCDTEKQHQTAPAGCVIVGNQFHADRTNENGSDFNCSSSNLI